MSKVFEYNEGSISIKEFWIITPIKGTNYSLAGTTRLEGLAKTVLSEAENALKVVEQNAILTKDTSKTIVKAYKKNLIVVAIAGLFFLTIVFIFLRLSFIKPIGHLTKIANKISSGDMKVRTGVKTKDELQILGETFNTMMDRIANQITKLGQIDSAGKKIASTIELKTLMQFSIETIVNLINVKKESIYILNEKTLLFENYANYGWDSNKTQDMKELTPDKGLAGSIIASGQKIIINNLQDNEELEYIDEANLKECTSLLSVPIKYKDNIIGIINIMDKSNNSQFSEEDAYITDTIVTSIAIQLNNIKLLEETADKARMEQELQTAKAVQDSLFPSGVPEVPQIELSGFFKSASETGGDWYGFISDFDDDNFHILIGDVTGHGTPAALVTAAVKGACTTLNIQNKSIDDLKLTPGKILHDFNKTVFETGHQKFVMTFFGSTYNFKTGKITFSNAGHNNPFIYRNGILPEEIKKKPRKKVSVLASERGHRLGFKYESTYDEKSEYLNPKDVILFYTDGLIECENHEGTEYGKRQIRNVIAKNASKNAEEIKEALLKDAFNFFGETPLNDDVTFIVFKINEDAVFEREKN